MRLYDISRELMGSPVYPGDPMPQRQTLQDMALGDTCNLSALSLCAHNGIHMDAPLHFVPDGAAVDEIAPEDCCGVCRVVAFEGLLLGDEAERLLAAAPCERLLFKGDMSLDVSAAYVLADAGLRLVGVEAPSVATAARTEAVHRHLLGYGVCLLEGLDLSAVPEGVYFLFAAPLKIAGCEGAPVRALLLDRDEMDVEPAFVRR